MDCKIEYVIEMYVCKQVSSSATSMTFNIEL